MNKVDNEISIQAYFLLLNLLLLIVTDRHKQRAYIKSEEEMFVLYIYLNNLEPLERCVQSSINTEDYSPVNSVL